MTATYDTAKTIVIFREERISVGNWRPVAIFPEIPGRVGETTSATCFSPFGEHSACPLDYVRHTRPARPGPALDALRAGLESRGYVLDERLRISPKMRANLRAAHAR
jgi:hypothetical protein